MYYLDSEKSIIKHFQSVKPKSVYFPIESEEVIKVFESIHDQENWKLWIESAGKADPPPDFFSDTYKYMMEAMRVDDHSFKNKKGKVVNPTNSHIRDLEKEIMQSGIMEMCPNAELMINAFTDLPTNKDHNYKYYYKNFIRIVEHHKKRIALYKRNHPNYKVIFFIMDESSAYIEAKNIDDLTKERQVGEMVLGQPHLHFMDKRFIMAFENSDIDYLIWYTPFKLINSPTGKLDLPEVCVFDNKRSMQQSLEYDENHMVSVEI
ncbi:MAG: hypothetical protein HDR18_13775 [Lachnospiraceae bacterium]|nr:hypothetical protein [Lachnospiraceae bacterium]